MTTTASRPVHAGVVPATATCSCGTAVRTVRVVSGPGRGTDIPIDIDRDPDGILAAAKDGDTWGVRLLPADQRRLATGSTGYLDRSGPCAACGQKHPYHYGPGDASPLCDPCRTKIGLKPIATLITNP